MSNKPALYAFSLNLPGFLNRAPIPKKFTCDGLNISPALAWDGISPQTKSLALIMDDPDAPVGTWIHWVIYNILPIIQELPENIPPQEKMTGLTDSGRVSFSPKGPQELFIQGINSWNKIGYGGPCPPPGKPHRYFFKLYALSTPPNLPVRLNAIQLQYRINPNIIAKAEWMGIYQH